jgi:hypothetical protein
MKLVHVAPHLDGDVGKAHAAIASVLPGVVQKTYVLLEEPREWRHAEALAACGAEIVVSGDFGEVSTVARAADIVQFEFWDHPRVFECLARAPWPEMRTMVWSHISGLAQPFVPTGLIEIASRFVFTTPASLSHVTMQTLSRTAKRNVWAINSHFGVGDAAARTPVQAAQDFMILWLGMLSEPKRVHDFRGAIGETPEEWRRATQDANRRPQPLAQLRSA